MDTYTEIQGRIAAAAAKQDFDEAARLAQIASQLKKLDEQKHHLLAAAQPVSPSQPPIPPVSPANGLHMQNPLNRAREANRGALTVDLTTKGGAPIRISERTSSDTVVVLMERILTHFGMPGLEKLTGLRVNRGPLVSPDPRRDYRNPKKGDLYSHHRIPGTNLYVLTHSSNAEKLKFIPAALRMLGLSESAFRVSLS